MSNPFGTWAKLDQQDARDLVVLNFDKLVHDYHCLCDTASAVRAAAALAACDWTIQDAFSAWYEAFLSGVIGA